MNEQSNEAADDPSINGLAPPGPDSLGSGYKPLLFTPGTDQNRLEAPQVKQRDIPYMSGP